MHSTDSHKDKVLLVSTGSGIFAFAYVREKLDRWHVVYLNYDRK